MVHVVSARRLKRQSKSLSPTATPTGRGSDGVVLVSHGDCHSRAGDDLSLSSRLVHIGRWKGGEE